MRGGPFSLSLEAVGHQHPIDGLHEVKVVVENSKSGTAIYELQTLLFEVPRSSTMDPSSKRKDSAKSKRKEAKRR